MNKRKWLERKDTPPWDREGFRRLFPNYLPETQSDEEKERRRGKIEGKSHDAGLLVGHFRQNPNHFHYLINMESLLDESLTVGGNREVKLHVWLDEVKDERDRIRHQSSQTPPIIFDVIVYPDRRTNERLAGQINSRVFGNSAHQIPVDVAAEERVTFHAKHAWLTGLARRAGEVNGRVDIHFVDCGIVRGSTLRRVESLFSSLLEWDEFRFSSVFQLANRLSEKTLKHMAGENQHYEYADIYAGHLQTHDNSCYLCSYDRQLRSIERSTSLASVTSMIREKRLRETVEMRADQAGALVPVDHNRRAYWDPKDDVRLQWCTRQMWGYHRLAWTHWWNVNLRPLTDEEGKDRYDKSDVLSRVIETLNKELVNALKPSNEEPLGCRPTALEHLMGALASLADQPFAQQMGVHDACLTTVVSLAMAVIHGSIIELPAAYKPELSDAWKAFQRNVLELCIAQSELATDFVRCLMRQTTVLGSSWLIRKKTVISLFVWAVRSPGNGSLPNLTPQERLRAFSGFYLYCLRLLLMTGNDRASAARWEYLLINGEEYGPKSNGVPPSDLKLGETLVTAVNNLMPDPDLLGNSEVEDIIRSFVDMAFVENTRIIQSVLTSLGTIEEENDIEVFPPEYFPETMKWVGIEKSRTCLAALREAAKSLPTEWGPSMKPDSEVIQEILAAVKTVWTAFTDTSETEVCLLVDLLTKPLILVSEPTPHGEQYKVDRSDGKACYLKITSSDDKTGNTPASFTEWTDLIEAPSHRYRWWATPSQPGVRLVTHQVASNRQGFDVLLGDDPGGATTWAVFRLGLWRNTDNRRSVREAYLALKWRNPRKRIGQRCESLGDLSLKVGMRAVLSLRGRIQGMIMTERGDELMDGLVSKKLTERQLLKLHSVDHSQNDREDGSAGFREAVKDMVKCPLRCPEGLIRLSVGAERDRIIGDMNRWLLLGEIGEPATRTLEIQEYVRNPKNGEDAKLTATVDDWLEAMSQWLYACPEWTKAELVLPGGVVTATQLPLDPRDEIYKLLKKAVQGIPRPVDLYPTAKISAILLTTCIQGACNALHSMRGVTIEKDAQGEYIGVSRGSKQSGSKTSVRVDIVDKGTYVAVRNAVGEEFCLESVRAGVAHQGSGISLSVVAGVFHAIAPDHPVRFHLSNPDPDKGYRVFSVEMPILIHSPEEVMVADVTSVKREEIHGLAQPPLPNLSA